MGLSCYPFGCLATPLLRTSGPRRLFLQFIHATEISPKMTVKNNSNNESAVETQSTADLQIRIRELEKEIARLHGQIKEQRYGLTWLDVPEAFETESENKIPILEEVKEKAIDAAGRDALNASVRTRGTAAGWTHGMRLDRTLGMAANCGIHLPPYQRRQHHGQK